MREDLEGRELDPAAADDEHARLLDVCMGEASRARTDCGLEAQTLDELERC